MSQLYFAIIVHLTDYLRTKDCMHYHVCKFSTDVEHSYRVPVPREDAPGFIQGVKHAISDAHIDLVIPMHEEIFYLAQAAQSDTELKDKLLAPPFKTLIRLHNKWEFSKLLDSVGLDHPQAELCKSPLDVENLDKGREWALKPVFGRAATNVFHLKPGEPMPKLGEGALDVGEDDHYIAQEWLYGQRYCSYAVVKDGTMTAFAIYPVEDTIDGEFLPAHTLKCISDRLHHCQARLVCTSDHANTRKYAHTSSAL